MEDLNKHQLILLTLLVSFVTSIATGVITYTLLQEAPVEVTQNINRVVERTIEKVVPVETEGGEKEIIREVQVVNEEELVLESIDKNSKSIVRIKTIGFDGSEIVVGVGFVAADGIVVTDERVIASGNYSISFYDGKTYGVSKTYKEKGLIFLKVGKPVSEKYVYYPAILGNSLTLKLGQTVVAIGGKQSNSVSIGRVSQLMTSGEDKSLASIVTSIQKSKAEHGSPLLNLEGEVVGLEAGIPEEGGSTTYFPVNTLKASLATATLEFEKN